jgi:hypothetical protein
MQHCGVAFRIATTSEADRALVDALRQRARAEGTTLSQAVREAFAAALKDKPKKRPAAKRATKQ